MKHSTIQDQSIYWTSTPLTNAFEQTLHYYIACKYYHLGLVKLMEASHRDK